MTSGLWLIVALGLLLVFAVQESQYWGPSVIARVRAWWRRRQLKKRAAYLHRLRVEFNPRGEAWRTFTRTGAGPAGQGVGREDLATAGSSLRRPIQVRKELRNVSRGAQSR